VDESGVIIKGHGRRLAALDLGLTEVPVIVRSDLSEAQKKACRIHDNKSAESDYDIDALKVEFEALAELNYDLDLTGFDKLEIGDFFLDGEENDHAEKNEEEQSGPGGPGEEDEEEEAPPENLDTIVSRVKPGEVWEVAGHRVMCGDCRDAAQVKFLLGNEPINLSVTSPPYASQRKYDEESGFKPIKPNDYLSWYEPVQSIIKQHLAQDGSYFLNIKESVEDGSRHLYVKKLTIAHAEEWSWRFVDEFVWKRPGVPGKWKDRFKNAWEPVFHFAVSSAIKFNPLAVAHHSTDLVGDGEAHEAKSNGKYWNMPKTEKKEGLALPGNVLEIAASTGDAMGHSAPYPVKLPAFFIQAFSDEGDRVYDPFLGSGTTSVAAHKHKRIGLGMELSPKHCEIILRRLEKVTDTTAQLVDTYK
jgi:DNA modification methylase